MDGQLGYRRLEQAVAERIGALREERQRERLVDLARQGERRSPAAGRLSAVVGAALIGLGERLRGDVDRCLRADALVASHTGRAADS
jgi:hypothetical protein